MYNPVTKRIVISRDVVFDEKESWKWGKSIETEPGSSILKWGDEKEETGPNGCADEAEADDRSSVCADETEADESVENNEESLADTTGLQEGLQ